MEDMDRRILYVTDIHGSTSVWRKACRLAAMYDLDALVIGGDWIGKRLVYFTSHDGDSWLQHEAGKVRFVRSGEEKQKEQRRLEQEGAYVVESAVLAKSSEEKVVIDEGIERLEKWLSSELEQQKSNRFDLLLGLGNDDPLQLESCLARWDTHPRLQKICLEPVVWRGVHFVGLPDVPPTPWRTYRERAEEEIEGLLESALRKCHAARQTVLLAHSPPYDTLIDLAPEINAELKYDVQAGTVVQRHLGSKAVRAVIESGRVALGLHGHLHDSIGIDHIAGVPVCNPGSRYWQGVLLGFLIQIERSGQIHFRRVEW